MTLLRPSKLSASLRARRGTAPSARPVLPLCPTKSLATACVGLSGIASEPMTNCDLQQESNSIPAECEPECP